MRDAHTSLKRLLNVHGERAPPFAFAGREAIMTEILDAARFTAEQPIPGQTFLVQGAPGAGKTALLNQLSERWQPNASIVCAKVPDDSKVRLTWMLLAKQLTEKTTNELRATTHEDHMIEAGGDFIAKGMVGRRKGVTLPPLAIDSCAQISALAKGTPNSPVIVFIDEVQNIREHTGAAMLVEELHTQTDVPVLLVCAGLSNSEQKLIEIGLSRPIPNHVIPLGVLQPAEALDVARASLKKIAETVGLNPSGFIESFAEEIATRSDQWPRHLTCFLHGICRALLDQSEPSLDNIDRESALEHGEQLRNEYYQQRVTASGLPSTILADLYQRIDGANLSGIACAGILETTIEQYQAPGGRILARRFADGERAFEELLRAGIVTLNKHNECEIPIPSLTSFVTQLAEREWKPDAKHSK